MEDLRSTFRCDATGREIDDRFEMLTMTVFYEEQPLEASDAVIHLSRDAHELAYQRLVEYDYHAFVADSGKVGLIKELGEFRTKYYAKDTGDAEMAALFRTLNEQVLPLGG